MEDDIKNAIFVDTEVCDYIEGEVSEKTADSYWQPLREFYAECRILEEEE